MKLVFENKRIMNEGAFQRFFKGPGYYEIYVYTIDEDGSYSDSFVWGGGAEYYDSAEDLEDDLREIENIPIRRYAYNIKEVKKVDGGIRESRCHKRLRKRINENLSQNEFAWELYKLYKVLGSGVTNREAITKLQAVYDEADVGVVNSIDDRTLGGLYGMASGPAYEFRKRDDGMWEEIFDDHTPVTSEQMARMEVTSVGYQRRL